MEAVMGNQGQTQVGAAFEETWQVQVSHSSCLRRHAEEEKGWKDVWRSDDSQGVKNVDMLESGEKSQGGPEEDWERERNREKMRMQRKKLHEQRNNVKT